MLNWLLRYRPIVELLEREQATSVLDVGSGWFGLSHYWTGPVVQTDWAFQGQTPAEHGAGTAQYVQASAERLPFRNGAFTHVVSVDMLEHLAPAIREKAIHELARVSRNAILLAYPAGCIARRTDEKLSQRLARTPRRQVPPWLQEHLDQDEYPDRAFVSQALPEGWRVEHAWGLGNARMQGWLVYGEDLPILRLVGEWLEAKFARHGVPRVLNSGQTYRDLLLIRRTP